MTLRSGGRRFQPLRGTVSFTSFFQSTVTTAPSNMAAMATEAMRSGALGISTSRTLGHKVPDGRPVPGTWAEADELLAFGEVLRTVGYGLFEGAMPLGERDDAELTNTRAELAVMGEISRRSGRPLSYGLVQSDRRPDLYQRVIEFNREENARGAQIRPQTTARGIGMIYNLMNRTPWDRSPSWRELRDLSGPERLGALRDPDRRARLIADAAEAKLIMSYDQLFVLPEGDVVRLAVGADGHERLDALLAEEADREQAGREVAG